MIVMMIMMIMIVNFGSDNYGESGGDYGGEYKDDILYLDILFIVLHELKCSGGNPVLFKL